MTLSSCVLAPMMVISYLLVASASNNIENMAVVRYIDISTQLLIVNSQITLRNDNTYPIDSYLYIVDPEWVEDLSFIEAMDSKKIPLTVESAPKIEHSGKTVLQYKIFLRKPLSSEETTDFIVSLIVTNYLKSYPKSVKQNEKHTVLFPFNVYYHSMFFSHAQTTYLYTGTNKAVLIDGDTYLLGNDSEYGLRYGPFFNVEPFKNAQSVFHYENNSPFLIVESVKRYIKLSHWGFISVWDQIQLLHSGPKLKGPFKRSVSNKNQNSAPHDTRIERFYSTLPRNAFDIYLKDDIGLIWTFKVDYDDPNGVVVSVVPRNILYGGWKTTYEIGYSLPISSYVTSHVNDEYILEIPLLDKIFANMVIKEAEINIIFPEGANFRTMDSVVGNKTVTKYCYYFDTTCREMITIKRYNLVENNINNLVILYTFSQINLLVKPLTIAMYLYFIFILLKLFSRSHFSLQSEKEVRQVQSNEFPIPVTSTIKKKNKRNLKQKQF